AQPEAVDERPGERHLARVLGVEAEGVVAVLVEPGRDPRHAVIDAVGELAHRTGEPAAHEARARRRPERDQRARAHASSARRKASRRSQPRAAAAASKRSGRVSFMNPWSTPGSMETLARFPASRSSPRSRSTDSART